MWGSPDLHTPPATTNCKDYSCLELQLMMQLNDKSKQLQSSGVHLKKKKTKKNGEYRGVLFSKSRVYLFCHRDISLRRVHTRLLCPQPASVCVFSVFISAYKAAFFPLLLVCVFGRKKKRQTVLSRTCRFSKPCQNVCSFMYAWKREMTWDADRSRFRDEALTDCDASLPYQMLVNRWLSARSFLQERSSFSNCKYSLFVIVRQCGNH